MIVTVKWWRDYQCYDLIDISNMTISKNSKPIKTNPSIDRKMIPIKEVDKATWNSILQGIVVDDPRNISFEDYLSTDYPELLL